jgi:radical SAM protein with 4Fe4S-binding SPASM domain
VYTNGTLIGERAASWLKSRDVSVVAKLNSLRPKVQDALAGRVGASDEIRRGIDALLEAGLASGDAPRLGLETIICRDNYDELPSMWRWMRERSIVPEVEIPTLHGRARDNERALTFDAAEAPARYEALFETLLEIDRREFGFDWIPHPPFVGMSCRLYYSNCYVNARGGVQPCAGVDQEFGVLEVGPRASEGTSLASVVTAPAFTKLRRIHEHLKPPCEGCDLLHTCYGCRGAAWNETGDLFAGDPVCWRTRAKPLGGR